MSGHGEDREHIIRRIQDVLASLPSLRVAYIYGSFLTREDFRDIDIALLADDQYSGDKSPAFASRAADALEAAVGFRHECDVRVINHEPVWFRYEVISTGRPVYVRDEDDRIDFETGVLVEYQDMKSMYDLFDREYLAQV
jgi:hypothetical protein